MKSRLVLLVVVCLAVTANSQELWGGESQRSPAGVYALEGLGALGGGVGCGCLGVVGAVLALVVTGYDMDQPSNTAATAAYTGVMVVSAAALPAAVGYGAATTGERLGEDGSTEWAVGGAYIAALAGAAVGALGWAMKSEPVYVSAAFLGGVAVPVGAVVGYNRGTGTGGRSGQLHFGSRLQLPSVALASAELPDHSVERRVKIQLAGLRF